MAIDISKLSAKELYELAQKKEQEEKAEAERDEKVSALKARREQMITEHKGVLALTEKKIREMEAQRDKLVSDHQQALAELDKEIAATGGTPAPTPATATAMPSSTPPGSEMSKLTEAIKKVMYKRPYVSASLIKEQLVAYGINVSDLNKQLDQLVREGKLISKSGGNYALGKNI